MIQINGKQWDDKTQGGLYLQEVNQCDREWGERWQ
jgi:hypothetical protein